MAALLRACLHPGLPSVLLLLWLSCCSHDWRAAGLTPASCCRSPIGCPNNSSVCPNYITHSYTLFDKVRHGSAIDIKYTLEDASDMYSSLDGMFSITEDGATVLTYSASSGYLEVLKEVLKYISEGSHLLEYRDRRFKKRYKRVDGTTYTVESRPTALMIATKMGYLEAVKAIMVKKPNLEATDAEGLTSLWWAGRQLHFQITKLLLEAKANPDVYNSKSLQSPLIYAALEQRTDFINLLTANGANASVLENQIGDYKEFYVESETGDCPGECSAQYTGLKVRDVLSPPMIKVLEAAIANQTTTTTTTVTPATTTVTTTGRRLAVDGSTARRRRR